MWLSLTSNFTKQREILTVCECDESMRVPNRAKTQIFCETDDKCVLCCTRPHTTSAAASKRSSRSSENKHTCRSSEMSLCQTQVNYCYYSRGAVLDVFHTV